MAYFRRRRRLTNSLPSQGRQVRCPREPYPRAGVRHLSTVGIPTESYDLCLHTFVRSSSTLIIVYARGLHATKAARASRLSANRSRRPVQARLRQPRPLGSPRGRPRRLFDSRRQLVQLLLRVPAREASALPARGHLVGEAQQPSIDGLAAAKVADHLRARHMVADAHWVGQRPPAPVLGERLSLEGVA
eukprot:6901451-Prymnesium_polylepis.2